MIKKLMILNPNYSTTKLCYKLLLDDKYLDKNGKIKEEYKFKLNFPEFEIIDSKIPARKDEKFDTYLFLPEGRKKEEGGLRTKGYFKFSYEKKDNKWYLVEDNKFIKEVSLYKSIKKDYSKLPLISIITVVFNGEKYLEKTIQSVINQTYPNIEYIIVDGGSTDKTLDIIKKYDNYIDYWVSEKDRGIYHAMNKGLKLCLGDYIAILNADDFYLKDAMEYSIKTILNDNAHYSIANISFTNGKIVKPIVPLKNKVYQEMPYPHISALIKKEIYKSIGMFDETFKIAGDCDIALRMILNNYKYTYLDKEIAIIEKGGVSDSIYANIEFYKVAVKNGKSNILAGLELLNQLLKIGIIKFFPNKLVKYIKKLKKSRFYD